MKAKATKKPKEPSFSGRKLSWWLRRLYEDELPTPEQDAARAAIVAIGEEAVPFLLGWLRQPGRNAFRAASGFRVLGDKAAAAIAEILRDPGPEPQAAGSSLGGIGLLAIEALVELLNHPDEMFRSAGAEGLSEIAEPFTDASLRSCLPPLVRNTKDVHQHVRARSASALGRIGKEPATCVPALVPLLNDHSTLVQASAVYALGCFGEAGAVALPRLLELLGCGDGPLRSFVVQTIAIFPGEVAIRAVQTALEDKDAVVRSAAIKGLSAQPKRAAVVVTQLMAILDSAESNSDKMWAAFSLGRLGPHAKQALPKLRRLKESGAAGGPEFVESCILKIEGAAHG